MIVGVVANRSKRSVGEAVELLHEALSHHGLTPLYDERLASMPGMEGRSFGSIDELGARADLVAVFGGDGTMLATGRSLAGSGVPMLGFNLGRLGFMAEFSVDEIPSAIESLLAEDYRVVERTLLSAEIDGVEEPLIGMNDLVIDKRETRLLVDLDVTVNGDYLGTYSADGLIVATPTGSTAYALSVGGPVVAPNTGVIVIAPIAPHMLTARPIVLSDEAVIRVTPTGGEGDGQEVRIIADGQNSSHIQAPQSIVIQKHPERVRLIKSAKRTYFDVLRAKLLWGRRPSLEGPES